MNIANAMNNLNITSNTFYVPGADITGHPGGILLQNCTGYNIAKNTFDKGAIYTDYPGSSRGIQVSFGNSWTDYNNIIHNNTFNHLRHPAIALQKNSDVTFSKGLQWKCNDFLDGNSRSLERLSGVAGGSYIAATMKGQQGIPDKPAANRFYTTCNIGNTPSSRERLFADFLVTEPVDYLIDPGGPEFDPTLSCISSYYNNIYTTIPIIYTKYCDPNSVIFDDPGTTDGGPTMKPGRFDDSLDHVTEGPLHDYLIAERDILISTWARYYGRQGAYDSAAALLIHYGRYAEALPFCIELRNWALANATWESLPKTTEDQQDYAMLTRKTIDLYSSGYSWNDIDGEARESLLSIATKNSYPGFMAASIADRMGIRPFIWPYAEESEAEGKGTAGSTGNNVGNTATNSFFRFSPNPTTGAIRIDTRENGIFYITNIEGRSIATFTLKDGNNSINMPQVAAGIYLGRFCECEIRGSYNCKD